jgi:hypothetical protein
MKREHHLVHTTNVVMVKTRKPSLKVAQLSNEKQNYLFMTSYN